MQNNQLKDTERTYIIIVISLILGLLFDYFFYNKIPGISFPLYVLLIISGLFLIAKFFKRKVSREILLPLTFLIFFSTMVFVRSSGLLVFFNIIISIVLLLIITEISFCGKIKDFLIADYVKIFLQPVKFFQPSLHTFFNMFLQSGIKENRRVFSQIIKGFLIAIPFLFVFLLLLSSSDLIFQKFVSGLFGINNELEMFLRFLLILLVMFVFIGAYAYSFCQENKTTIAPENNSKHALDQIETSILLCSINILFFIFTLVQLTYLFKGESNITAHGFTYAQYARRGFFELITVAGISFLLLITVEKYITKKKTGHIPGFKILSTVLILQVLLIMASAFTRLSLYEEAYGFTTLRLYSHSFIILLAIIFCLLLYKILIDITDNKFAFNVFLSIMLFMTAMNCINPDSCIARKNIERFELTGKMDINYLSQLSDDAIPVIIEALNDLDDNLKKELFHELYWRSQDTNSSALSQWQSLNISRRKANVILQSQIPEFEQYKDYQQ